MYKRQNEMSIENKVDFASLVEPRLSTTQTRWIAFSSATRPFGMVNASPDTRIDGDWGCGYDFGDTTILGFSHIHEWQIGALLIMPVSEQEIAINKGPDAWKSEFSHDFEIVKPGYHKVNLDRYGITSELTATPRVVFHRHTFPSGKNNNAIIVDLASTLGPCNMGEASLKTVEGNRIEGSVINEPTFRRPKPLKIYFAMVLDRNVETVFFTGDQVEKGVENISCKNLRAKLRWKENDQPLIFKIGFSYTSIEAAWANTHEETGNSLDFDNFRQEAHDQWNEWLGRVEVESSDTERRNRFYTDMYFAFLGRRTMNDISGTYIDNTGDASVIRQIPLNTNNKPEYRHFNSDSFWGAQWTITPFWSIVCPEIINEFCQCYMDMYRNGGLIPRGPSGGNYTFVMTSAQTTPFFVHALLSGIYKPENISEVYQALRKNHFPGGLMSKAGYEHQTCKGGGLEDYINIGYIPEDIGGNGYHQNGAAQTLEHAYNDACLAVLASMLGYKDDAELFEKRSKNYRNLFDSSIGFMRPRNRNDGSWLENYNPFDKRGWTEAGGWNYTFYVPHDIEGLTECFWTKDNFFELLEKCFELSSNKGFKAPHGRHEETSLDFGNEPALGIPGLFHAAGKPERTQYWLWRIVNELKSGNTPIDGYGGDEDQGMMGAWNALVSMGLFTITGGCERKPEMMITTPLFDKIIIHTKQTDGSINDLTIIKQREPGAEHSIYINQVLLNGKRLERLYLSREEIFAGGEVVIEAGEKWQGILR